MNSEIIVTDASGDIINSNPSYYIFLYIYGFRFHFFYSKKNPYKNHMYL